MNDKEILQELLIKPSVPKTLYRIERKFELFGLDEEDIITLIKRYSTVSRIEIKNILKRLRDIETKIIAAERKRTNEGK